MVGKLKSFKIWQMLQRYLSTIVLYLGKGDGRPTWEGFGICTTRFDYGKIEDHPLSFEIDK